MAERIPTRLTSAEGRKFALTVGAAFLALAGLTWWRDHLVAAVTLATLGTGLWAAGLLGPERLGPVQKAWMGLAHAISKVTTPIFLGFVYFLVLMPIGVLMRALGRNPIRHRPTNGSFWMSRDTPVGDLTNQF